MVVDFLISGVKSFANIGTRVFVLVFNTFGLALE